MSEEHNIKAIKVSSCKNCPKIEHWGGEDYTCDITDNQVDPESIDPDCPLPDHIADTSKKVVATNPLLAECVELLKGCLSYWNHDLDKEAMYDIADRAKTLLARCEGKAGE